MAENLSILMQQATQQLYSWTSGVWIVILVFPAVPRIIHQSSHPQTRISFHVCPEHLFLRFTVIQCDPINFSSVWEISLRSKLNFFTGGSPFWKSFALPFPLLFSRDSNRLPCRLNLFFILPWSWYLFVNKLINCLFTSSSFVCSISLFDFNYL